MEEEAGGSVFEVEGAGVLLYVSVSACVCMLCACGESWPCWFLSQLQFALGGRRTPSPTIIGHISKVQEEIKMKAGGGAERGHGQG